MNERSNQYQLDLNNLAGIPDADAVSYDDIGNDFLGTHDENLFDQNEDASGNPINESTGEPYDNATFTELEGLTVYDSFDLDGLSEQEDAAAQWLAEAYQQEDREQTAAWLAFYSDEDNAAVNDNGQEAA